MLNSRGRFVCVTRQRVSEEFGPRTECRAEVPLSSGMGNEETGGTAYLSERRRLIRLTQGETEGTVFVVWYAPFNS